MSFFFGVCLCVCVCVRVRVCLSDYRNPQTIRFSFFPLNSPGPCSTRAAWLDLITCKKNKNDPFSPGPGAVGCRGGSAALLSLLLSPRVGRLGGDNGKARETQSAAGRTLP